MAPRRQRSINHRNHFFLEFDSHKAIDTLAADEEIVFSLFPRPSLQAKKPFIFSV